MLLVQFVALPLGLLFCCALGERIAIQANRSACFYRDMTQGASGGVQFQAETEPVRITNNGRPILERPEEKYGSYAFTADADGRCQVCFVNPGSDVRMVSFSQLGDAGAMSPNASSQTLDPVQESIKVLNNGLRGVRDEQELLLRRENQHRQMAESTRARVSWWFVLQTLLLGSVVYFQIWYLKRFFETRRVM